MALCLYRMGDRVHHRVGKILAAVLLGLLPFLALRVASYSGSSSSAGSTAGGRLISDVQRLAALSRELARPSPEDRIARRWTVSVAERAEKYEDTVQEAAHSTGLSPELIRAVILIESSFNPSAVSPKGARGLMQLMPGTASDLKVGNALDGRKNILAGARYLRSLLDRFDGNTRFALAAYNAGPGNVLKYGGVPPYAETISYVREVRAAERLFMKLHAQPIQVELLLLFVATLVILAVAWRIVRDRSFLEVQEAEAVT